MQVSIKGRMLALGTLLVLYLAAVLLLSAVTLYEPRSGGLSTLNQLQAGKLTSLENVQSPRKSSAPSASSFQNSVASLSGNEYSRVQALRPGLRRARLAWCSQLTYLQPPRYATALASFPGSGNTWLRYLLQQATGYYTGSIYKDYGLLKNGFPAESITNGSVIVVKTHEIGERARAPFSRAVLLVRPPAPAIQAEFNRQSGGHVGFASPDRYKRTKGKYWQQFVKDKLADWRNTNLDWLRNFRGPTHVIFYEKLVEDVEGQLKDLFRFLQVEVPPDKLRCTLDRKEGIYRRRKRILNFDPFSPQMKKMIQEEQDNVYNEIITTIRRR